MAVVAVPSHNVWLARLRLTVGVGSTVIVAICGIPTHVLAVGVTVMFAVMGVKPLFTAANDGTRPTPDAESPVEVLLLAHV